MNQWTYRVFGLDISFPREVRTLRGAQCFASATPDVYVTFGTVLPLPVMEIVNDDLDIAWSGGTLTIDVEEVGRFLVRDGRSIVVDPVPDAADDAIDLYLAGSIMGAILHQRAILPLHCNAIACNGRAVLLCGASGAGKSTLAAWFETFGLPLLTDDVCAISFAADGHPLAHPGVPRLRLWDDALEATGRMSQASRAIPWAEGKFELEMHDRRASRPLPIAAIYHLEDACEQDDFAITALRGLDAVGAVTSNIYRRRIADLVGRGAGYLHDAVSITGKLPVFGISRTWGFTHMEQQSLEITKHCKEICRKPLSANISSLIES